MRRALHVASGALGALAALLTGVFGAFYLADWFRFETYRLPPFSQTEYFFALSLIGVLGAAQGALALRAASGSRAAALTAISGAFAILGAIGSGAGRNTAGWLLYAGLVGLVAAAFASAEVPRRAWLGLVGILGAVLIYRAVQVLNQIVAELFP